MNETSEISLLDVNERILTSVAAHELWANEVLGQTEQGQLSRSDMEFLMVQHYHCTNQFTRLLTLLMSRPGMVPHLPALSENLLEEIGEDDGAAPHETLLRSFLAESFPGALEQIARSPHADRYFDRCYNYLGLCTSVQAAAFMGWGAEGIVARLYKILVAGLRGCGIEPEGDGYFEAHIACDDDHADVLQKIAVELKPETQTFDAWQAECLTAVEAALQFRCDLYDGLAAELELRRLAPVVRSVVGGPVAAGAPPVALSELTELLYQSASIDDEIRFNVQRIGLPTNVLDPRLLTIEPGSRNEHHAHAHETVLLVLEGAGEMTIGEACYPVRAHDAIHVPRWLQHSMRNTGNTPLRAFAITDYGLTGRWPGNTETSYRGNAQVADIAPTRAVPASNTHRPQPAAAL